MISANIPINKIETPLFKNFLQKYTGKSINSHTFYRDIVLSNLFNEKMKEIESQFEDESECYIVFDESTDSCSRHILNILIDKYSKVERNKPFLISVVEVSKTNAENINLEVLKVIMDFLKNDIVSAKRIVLLLTDAAPYAIKLAKC